MKKLTDSYELSNGIKIPCVGFGTWQAENGDIAYNAVMTALKAGYRHIDTAAIYRNEESVGQAIKDSGIPREEIFVTTKLWNKCRSYELCYSAFERSISKLGLDYVEVTVLCTEAEEKAVRSVMQKWQATLGVSFNVFVETATAEEIRTRISDGEWQIALTDISFPHLTAFNGLLQFTTGNSENILGFEDKKYDSLVGAIKTASGFDTSISATKEAEQYLLDSCVIIPLYGSPTYYGLGKGVDGVIFNSTGDVVYFRDTVVK